MPRIEHEEVEYKEKKVKQVLDRVTAILKGKKSEVFTKLADEYRSIAEQIEELNKQHENLNARIKDRMDAMFDAEDEVLTRVVESVSMVATLSKRTPSHHKEIETIDYDGLLEEIGDLVPALAQQMEFLVKKHTTVTKKLVSAKSPALRVTLNESEDDIFDKVEEYADLVGSVVMNNLIKYDKKISALDIN